MFRSVRPEPSSAAIAVLGIALAGYAIFTADLSVPKDSELTQINGTASGVARSRYQLTFLVEGAAGKRVLHYPHAHGDSASIRNLLEAQGRRTMRFGYLPASAAPKDMWGASYDTVYLLEDGGMKLRTPSDIRSYRQKVLGIELAISAAMLFVAWRRTSKST